MIVEAREGLATPPSLPVFVRQTRDRGAWLYRRNLRLLVIASENPFAAPRAFTRARDLKAAWRRARPEASVAANGRGFTRVQVQPSCAQPAPQHTRRYSRPSRADHGMRFAKRARTTRVRAQPLTGHR